MTSVPAAAAAVWSASRPEVVSALERCLVLVGRRPEVGLAALAVSDPAVAGDLEAWWVRCRALWQAAQDGDLAGRAWVRTRRTVLDAAQVTAKRDKRDLVAEFAALTEQTSLRDLVNEATGPDPNSRSLRARARAAGGSFTMSGEGSATLVVPLSGSLWWPEELGGPAWPGEIERTVTLQLRYAAWRDRRVRRLAGVQVEVTELWADPLRVSAAAKTGRDATVAGPATVG